MKVSIKHLSITFMGNEETKVTAAPTEFYSPYERELRAKLETAEMYSVNLKQTLLETKKQRDCLREQRDKLVARDKELNAVVLAMGRELYQINGWVSEYDNGAWPDHNAKGVGPVAVEVLHMMRDLWADLESRPLPKQLDLGVSMVERREHGPNVTQYGDCLFVAFREDDGRPIGAWHSLRDACQRSDAFNRTGTGWNAAAPVQPNPSIGPVGVGQPEPETPDTQPADLQSWLPGPATGTQAPQAKICPGGGCMNFLNIGQKYCGDKSCKRSQEVIEAVAMQAEPLREVEEAEPLQHTYSVCKKKGCEEPRTVGSSYCWEHRQRKE